MFGHAVSRWTILHFAVALTVFALAQALMAGGASYPTIALLAPDTFATVHLLTVGWLTLLMLGALHQFVPVITAQSKATSWPALASLLMIVTGLVGMEFGFVSLGGWLPPQVLIALPAGGSLVGVGAILATAPLVWMLWCSRPLGFSSRFVALGLVFLFATLGLGTTFAFALAVPRAVRWSAMFTEGLRLHLFGGLVGWFTLTAMGVSYRLLSMFTLAPEERGALGNAVLWLSGGGLGVAWLLGLAEAQGGSVPTWANTVAGCALALGVALYIFDMQRLYRARRRQKLELNAAMAIAALAALGACLVLAVAATVTGHLREFAGALGYLFVFGWLSGLGLSQLYKVVPFLTWLERYGAQLGKQVVPRVQDLVDEKRDWPWFVVYFTAVAAGTVCAALGWTLGWRIAIGAHLLATLMIIKALWLVRHGVPRDAQRATQVVVNAQTRQGMQAAGK